MSDGQSNIAEYLRRYLAYRRRTISRRTVTALRVMFGLLSLSGFLLGPTQASATLLYSGGEDIDFICNASGSCGVDTNSSTFRAGWARESVNVYGSNSDPASNRMATPTFTPSSLLWIHAQYCSTSYGAQCNGENPASGYQMLRVLDSSGNPTLIVRGTGVTGQLKVSSRTSAGVFTDLVTCSSAINSSLGQIDIYINYGSTGEFTIYNNSAKVCDFTGNVTNGDGASTLNQVEFASASTSASWSEVIIATTDTRAMARFTANTIGNGNTVGFTGTNVCSNIWNASAFNDSNFGYSGSSNVLQECTLRNAIPPGAYNVVGLGMSARVLVGSSGPLHFDFVTRTGGTDYLSTNFTPTNSFSNVINYFQTTNPATSAPWSVSDFQATGFNVGLETKP